MPGIELRQVSVSYAGRRALTNLNWTVKPASFWGITGVNGSGKSTLLYLLNGLIPHEIKARFSGQVLVDKVSTRNKPVSWFSQKVSLVFQNPDFSLFNLTVKEEVSFNNLEADVTATLKAVGLQGFANRDPQTLSFGQKQKLCLAAVLARRPDYLVLDEPTAMLDYKSSLELYEILKRLNRQGKTIIVVEHDTDLLLQYAQSCLILDSGKVRAMGKAKTVLAQKNLLRRLGIKIPQL